MWSNTHIQTTASFGDKLELARNEATFIPGPRSITLARVPVEIDISRLAASIVNFGERFQRSRESHTWDKSDELEILRVDL